MRKRNIRKTAAALTALALCAGVLTGCGGAVSSTASSVAASSAASSEASGADADALAAQNVADLIDAIYVQQRTDDTDAQCEAAKAAWDALTDAQKELVEGENADPDYFGRDTGDASKDDARNADEPGQDLNERHVKQPLPDHGQEQAVAGRTDGLEGNGHHIAQAESGIQDHLRSQQLGAVADDDGIAVKQHDQRFR